MINKKWQIKGYDTFEGTFYSVDGDYESEELAKNAAIERLQELEKDQPTKESGGQAPGGIQDQVFIVRPGGSSYRFQIKK